MKWTIYNKESIQTYLKFIEAHPYAGIWHYPEWLKLQTVSKKVENGFFFSIEKENKIVLAGLILVYSLRLKKNYIYIPGGILYNDMDEDIYDFFIEHLSKLAKENNVIFSRIDSIVPFSEDYSKIIKKKKSHEIQKDPAIPQFTNIIDLDKNENNILKEMKPKGRYNIKLAIKKGVIVNEVNKKNLKNFYEILENTSQRDGFFVNELNYYSLFLDIIDDSKIIAAEYDNKVLAAGIFTYKKRQALYYYGASSSEYRNLMAPYLVQWKAIQIAKNKGCRYFDFMGIESPEKKGGRLAGVTDFKLKFGGRIVKFNPSFNIIHNQIFYKLYKTTKIILSLGR